jgi:TonB family protein
LPVPAYPVDLQRAGIGGAVEISFVMKLDGSVANAAIVTSTQREFEGAVHEAVSRWKFLTQGNFTAATGALGMRAQVLFEPNPDDHYDHAMHDAAFVRARLPGHEVMRLALAKIREYTHDLPVHWDPPVYIYDTGGAVKWMVMGIRPEQQIWIDDQSGSVRLEDKAAKAK